MSLYCDSSSFWEHQTLHSWWLGYRADVKPYIKRCLSRARNKLSQHLPLGFLAPLPVPDYPWASTSLDFITVLPYTHNAEAILVVVDRLTAWLIAFHAKSCTASQAVDMQYVFRLHGCPDSFVMYRDTRWRFTFWQTLVQVAQR
jgi:hypothetical protein